jgi:hypothetical protein|nr:hypothetical protein [uncultured Flavobacterium sp.]
MYKKSELINLKTSFSKAFPDYFNQLEACKTDQQLKEVYEKIKLDALEKAKPFFSADDNPTGFPILALTPDQYSQLIDANGDTIKVVVTTMLNTAQIIQPSWSVGQTAAQFSVGGLAALGAVGVGAFNIAIGSGVVEMLAIAAGIEALTVAGVVAIIAVAIVAVIIPILYFMLKPACCFVVMLNETNSPLVWVDDYNYHGKTIGYVNRIPPAQVVPQPIPGAGTYVTCGFVQTDKRDDALVGTQYGFTYSVGSTNVNFGVECPLTSIYVDNNCFCEINSTSEDAANETDSKNALSYSASNANLNVSIKCNSGSGYVAYYIARIQDGTLN